MKTWDINGISLDFDFTNPEHVERVETAFEDMAEREKNFPQTKRISEKIRLYCMIYLDFFNKVFGDGTAEKIFAKTPVSIASCEEVYADFLRFVNAQSEEIKRKRTENFGKYSPKKPNYKHKKHR